MATTIPAGTLRLLLAFIGYRAKARKRAAAVAVNGSAPLPGLPSALAPLSINAGHRTAGDLARRALTADPVPDLQPPGRPLHRMQVRHADLLPLAWSALCWTAGHRSITGAHPYIPYYNKRLPCSVQRPAWRWFWYTLEVLRLTVCPQAWHRRCIVSLCGCCIVCAGMGKINRNAAVKPCKRF